MNGIATHDILVGSAARTLLPRDGLPNLPDLGQSTIFLDFDGTLVEIAPRPDAVTVPAGTTEMLAGLQAATGDRVAVVSGRGLADLEAMLGGYNGILVGSHGAETRIDGTRSVADQGQGAALAARREELAAWAGRRDGVILEEKPASLVLHYRGAPDQEDACAQVLDSMAQKLPGFAVRPSKMALELMPESVSKRDAVLELMEAWQGRLPVAIGDDRTDEGMFAAVNALGGHGVKVGPGETEAGWRVRDVAAVHSGLRRWLDAGSA